MMINERRCVGQIGHLNVLHGGRGGRGEIYALSLAIKERNEYMSPGLCLCTDGGREQGAAVMIIFSSDKI